MDDTERKGLGRWLQSKFVLGTARKIYLVIALLSLAVAILAFAAVLLFQLWGMLPGPRAHLPDARPPQAVAIDTATVAKSLAAPTNVRLMLVRITAPLSPGDPIGYFEADTPNGLSPYPNDFDIFGGPDAAQFERVPVTVRLDHRLVTRAGLRPTSDLYGKINAEFTTPHSVPPHFTVNVVARDRFGNATRPLSLTFSLLIGAAPAAANEQQGEIKPSELQVVARSIALYLDPPRTPAYFDYYRQAMRIPSECGASDDNADFVHGYGAAFDALKSKVTTSNITAFYNGVCAGWRDGIDKETAAQQASEAARNEAMAKYMTAKTADMIQKAGVGLLKHGATVLLLGAIMIFLFIALFLAFLAMENHSEALRQAVESLAAHRKDDRAGS